MKKKFVVISSNPNEKGGFVTKICHTTKANTVFGEKTKKETYYVSGTKQLDKDSEVEVDLSQFRVAEYPFEVEGENIMLKWLHVA